MTSTATSTLNGQPTVAQLVGDVVASAQELAQAHAAQMQAEVRTQGLRARNGTILLIVGLAIAVIGAIFLLAAVAVFLRDQLAWPGWVAWSVVGIGTIGIGVGLHLAGHQTWRRVHFLPTRSLESLQESLTWIARTQN